MFKIFVGNLDYKVRPDQVRELFTLYAPIEDLVMPTDPKTNKPRGFAIVMIRDPELGAAAVRGVQGKRLLGRELVVNEAIKKKGQAPPAASGPVRSGPFGPKMFRKGDSRGGGSRNPRRSAGSGSTLPKAFPTPQVPGPPTPRPPVAPAAAAPQAALPKPTVLPVRTADHGDPSGETPKLAPPKARPKSSPSA